MVKPPVVVKPPADTRKPKLTFTVARRQKLARKGTFAVRLTCDEACTVTLATSVKPPGTGSRTRKASRKITLRKGRAVTVNVAVPRQALAAVRSALKARKLVTVSLTASARDAARNTSAQVKRSTTLRP